MTAPGGDTGENAQNEGEQRPSEGTYEAPPIEQHGQPSYETPAPPPTPSGYPTPGYETPGYAAPTSYPPASGYPPPSYPPPGYTPPPSYPPPNTPPTGYGPPGYPDPSSYQNPQQYGGASYPPPPPPQYGGEPYAGAYGQAPPASGTNTLAIASLVASVIGVLCGIGSIIGIVLGVVALNQIKQTRQAGYGLAIAGIVVGAASLVISLIWTIYAFN
jgi:hypothetical protein